MAVQTFRHWLHVYFSAFNNGPDYGTGALLLKKQTINLMGTPVPQYRSDYLISQQNNLLGGGYPSLHLMELNALLCSDYFMPYFYIATSSTHHGSIALPVIKGAQQNPLFNTTLSVHAAIVVRSLSSAVYTYIT